MEESEKRKERLKAMRTAAAEAETLHNNGTLPGPSCLSNPLNESPGPQSGQEESGATPRFDFYTNPMAAFSGNKRTSAANLTQQNYPTLNHAPQSNREFPSPSGPRNLESFPCSPQWQPRFPPNQRPYQPDNTQRNFIPYQNPRGNFHPYPINEGFPPQGSNRPDGPPNFYYPPNPPRGYNIYNPNFPNPFPSHSGHPNFTPGHGESQWRGNSNFQGQGRGQSYGRNAGGSGRGCGGQGFGFHGSGSGSGRPWGPERFYDRSMVEDPWKDLSPVIWTPMESSSTSSDAWMPHSIRSKKPKVENSPNKFSGGLSLAEFLAASFNDSVSENEKDAEGK